MAKSPRKRARVRNAQRNAPPTEALRERLHQRAPDGRPLLGYGDEQVLAEATGMSCSSVAHQVEGSNRLSADLVIAIAASLPPDIAAVWLNPWLRHAGLVCAPLPTDSAHAANLVPAAASTNREAADLLEVAALASADNKIDTHEAAAIEEHAARLIARATGLATAARRAAA